MVSLLFGQKLHMLNQVEYHISLTEAQSTYEREGAEVARISEIYPLTKRAVGHQEKILKGAPLLYPEDQV